jgi:predicted metalloprotease
MITVLALLAGCATSTAGRAIVAGGNAASIPATTAIPTPTPTPTPTATVTVQSTVTQTATQTQTTPAQPSTPPPSVPAAPPGMSDVEIRTEVASAVGVVETYWVDLFNTWVDDDGNPVTWWTPELLNGDGFYDSASGPLPSCDGDNDTAGNAFFCGSIATGTGFMAWDMQFLRDYSHFGDVVFYMVVAHETAHAAQVRFEHDGEAPAVLDQRELQADCIGGATLAKAEQDGYLTIDDADLAEMTEVSHALGDYAGDGHGTPQQRDSWFMQGYHGDIESCLGNR